MKDRSSYTKTYYKKHKDAQKQRCLKWNLKNKNSLREYTKKYLKLHKTERSLYAKEYYEKHKEQIAIKQKQKGYRDRREYIRKYRREKYKNDPNYRLEVIYRGRLLGVLKAKGIKKNIKSLNLLGCAIQEFRAYIESKWLPNMNWNNHGFGNNKWHLDHIKPISSFNLTNLEEQKRCFHYTNIQPLWQKDNFKKGAR